MADGGNPSPPLHAVSVRASTHVPSRFAYNCPPHRAVMSIACLAFPRAWENPWHMTDRRARDPSPAPWLAGITVAYLVWSLAPIALAIIYSFNAGSSITHWEG